MFQENWRFTTNSKDTTSSLLYCWYCCRGVPHIPIPFTKCIHHLLYDQVTLQKVLIVRPLWSKLNQVRILHGPKSKLKLYNRKSNRVQNNSSFPVLYMRTSFLVLYTVAIHLFFYKYVYCILYVFMDILYIKTPYMYIYKLLRVYATH